MDKIAFNYSSGLTTWLTCQYKFQAGIYLVLRQDLPSVEAQHFVLIGSQQVESKVTMPNYTLHYFNGRGRAEIMRMMFHMAGVKYMDKRYEFSDWDRCRNGKEIFVTL